MARTPNLNIPLIEHGEVNGDVTIREGSQITDLHGQSICEALTTTEPGSPQEGQAWIINGTPTGPNWGSDAAANQVAHFYAGVWNYNTPIEGWRFYNKADRATYLFDGIQWESYSAPGCYLGGSTDTFTLNTTDSLILNYSQSGQWNWVDDSGVFPGSGQIIVPKTGFYRLTANVIGRQGNTTKEEDIVLKLDVVNGPSPGRYEIAVTHVATDKGDRWRQLQTSGSRQLTQGEVLSLYMWASASLGTFTIALSTFEISFLAESGEIS